jgi:hypothetical protein
MTREVPGAGSRGPMQTWEKYYWFGGIGTVAGLLYWWAAPKPPPPKTAEQLEEERQQAEQLERERARQLRAVAVAGGDWVAGSRKDDPFDGMSPKEIEAYVKEKGMDPDDLAEGMLPHEIDAFVEEEQARRQVLLDKGLEEAVKARAPAPAVQAAAPDQAAVSDGGGAAK